MKKIKKFQTIRIPAELHQEFINFLSLSLSRVEDDTLRAGADLLSNKEKKVLSLIQKLVDEE